MTIPYSGPRPSDRFIPWYFVAFFVALTGILGGFVALAAHSYSGVTSEHAYEDGVAYNRILRASAAQQALGWKERITITPVTAPAQDAKQGARAHVVFALHDAAGHSLDKAQVKAVFMRPTARGLDQTVILSQGTDGSYEALVALPAHGVWAVYFVAMVDGHEFQAMRRIVLP